MKPSPESGRQLPVMDTRSIPAPSEISKREMAILEAMTPEHIDRVEDLHTESLTKHKAGIVGMRSEDIFFFLENVSKGHFPIGTGPFMLKSEGRMHLTPNPESDKLKADRPDLLEGVYQKRSFGQIMDSNLFLYESIAIKQAVMRNVIPLIRDPNAFWKEVSVIFAAEDDRIVESHEEYFEDLAREIQERRTWLGARDQESSVGILDKHLPGALDRRKLAKYLSSLRFHGGIAIGFNESLLERYRVSAEDADVDASDEMVAFSGDGSISMDCVLGFEPLGDFEDRVLKKLGVII